MLNAVTQRSRSARQLKPDDFEVTETESRPRRATALLLDLSFSMPLRGHWIPAKKMALALHALIEGKYPDDSLYLVGFSDYARQMKPAELATAGWEEVHGTNMQHAFLLARRLLADDRRRQAGDHGHRRRADRSPRRWPGALQLAADSDHDREDPTRGDRLARSGIQINVFMLEESAGLTSFMERLAKLTGGTTTMAESAHIGNTIINDYLGWDATFP